MVRALVTAAILLVSSAAAAATGEVWRVGATATRPGLPKVEIELGYPGPYVPWRSAPVTLRATAGDRRFDGYVGFHFRVQEQRTYDTPVIARAVIEPHQTWTFSTFATLQRRAGAGSDFVPRTIAVEWRDASMALRAFRAAGAPPWDALRPLRIGHELDTAGAALGEPAWPQTPRALSDHAQWYAGFSHVVAPLAVWSDLPRRVRDAVLGSGTDIVLFGLPQPGQQLDALDQTLLPVTFDASPGSYEVPWPYGSGTAAVPRSWRVRAGANAAGRGPLPYLVRSPAVTWFADERGIEAALPATEAIPLALEEARARELRFDPEARIGPAWPRPSQVLRVHSSLLLVAAAALLGLGGWLVFRRNPRAGAAAALLVAAILIVGSRERVRPSSGTYRYEIDHPLTRGIRQSMQLTRSWGPSPLAEERRDRESMRTSVTGVAADLQDAEVRATGTPVSMGMMKRLTGDWHAVTRWSVHRGPGEPPRVSIAGRNGNALTVEYESVEPVDVVQASWMCGTEFCRGGASVPRGRRGRATIRDGRHVWEEGEPFIWYVPMAPRATSEVHVSLVSKSRTRTRVQEWVAPLSGPVGPSFMITDRLWPRAGGCSYAFALPTRVSPEAEALVSVKARDPRVELVWKGGTTALQPTGRPGVAFASRSWSVPPEVLRGIVAGGGIMRVDVLAGKGPEGLETRDTVSIEIREKKP